MTGAERIARERCAPLCHALTGSSGSLVITEPTWPVRIRAARPVYRAGSAASAAPACPPPNTSLTSLCVASWNAAAMDIAVSST